jgi:hypothetical protein
MEYLHYMIRILRFDEVVYREVITRDKLSLLYTAINVGVFGLCYGLSATYFARFLLAAQGEEVLPAHLRVTLILMGVSVAFLIHGGMALFAWVFCRGFGGSTLFLPIYLALGLAWIALWPLAPALAALQAQWTGGMFYVFLALALLLALNVIFRALKSASGLNFGRMLLVMVVILLYISCFMYLWVG